MPPREQHIVHQTAGPIDHQVLRHRRASQSRVSVQVGRHRYTRQARQRVQVLRKRSAGQTGQRVQAAGDGGHGKATTLTTSLAITAALGIAAMISAAVPVTTPSDVLTTIAAMWSGALLIGSPE